jgi:hypothetical protein
MLCYGFLTKSPACSAKVSPNLGLLLHLVDPRLSTVPFPTQSSKTHYLVFLISKHVVPYWTHGDTDCSRGLLLKTGP